MNHHYNIHTANFSHTLSNEQFQILIEELKPNYSIINIDISENLLHQNMGRYVDDFLKSNTSVIKFDIKLNENTRKSHSRYVNKLKYNHANNIHVDCMILRQYQTYINTHPYPPTDYRANISSFISSKYDVMSQDEEATTIAKIKKYIDRNKKMYESRLIAVEKSMSAESAEDKELYLRRFSLKDTQKFIARLNYEIDICDSEVCMEKLLRIQLIVVERFFYTFYKLIFEMNLPYIPIKLFIKHTDLNTSSIKLDTTPQQREIFKQ